MTHSLYRKMLNGEISSYEYARSLKEEVRAERPKISHQSKEDIALTSLAALSIAGIILIWWLS